MKLINKFLINKNYAFYLNEMSKITTKTPTKEKQKSADDKE